MERFKIELFEKNGKKFPSHKSLSSDEIREHLVALANRMNMPIGYDERMLLKKIRKNSRYVMHIDLDAGIDLLPILNNLKHTLSKEIFINWDDFKSVDEMVLDDLINNFSDIWYPDADDIELFDFTHDWVYSLRHDGALYLWKGNRRNSPTL